MLWAAVGDFVGRTMTAAVHRYDTHVSVDDKLQRLEFLVSVLHAVVEQAEGVHHRSWWLRRWLWRLRDSALDGDEVKAVQAAACRGGRRHRHWCWRQAVNAAEATVPISEKLIVPGQRRRRHGPIEPHVGKVGDGFYRNRRLH